MRRRILLALLGQALIVCLLAPGGTSQTIEQAGRGRPREAGGYPAGAASVSAIIRESAIPLTGGGGDYDALMNLVGDARMTDMGERGELSLGHLMRQFHDGASVLVGFTIYEGEVRAATAWGVNGRKMKVRPALAESYSGRFHETGVPNFLLILRGGGALAEAFAGRRLERAIGVVYLPDTEQQSHYFAARLSKQFDAVIHLDKTSAVVPLK